MGSAEVEGAGEVGVDGLFGELDAGLGRQRTEAALGAGRCVVFCGRGGFVLGVPLLPEAGDAAGFG